MPSERKDLMFDIRRREEADGDRRMIGNERREEVDETASNGFFGIEPGPADGTGGLIPGFALPDAYWPGRDRLRPRKISAVLRT
jgi:hypothetical protein